MWTDSLESCKGHYELGLVTGQHRKLKELLSWLKKKKRRTIRKDELLNFLIGGRSDDSAMIMAQPSGISTGVESGTSSMIMTGSGGGGTATTMMLSTAGTGSCTLQSKQPFLFRSSSSASTTTQQQQQQQQQQIQPQQQQSQPSLFAAALLNSRQQQHQSPTPPPSSHTTVSSLYDTSSDLATFREALIMHSKCFFWY